MKQIVRVMSDMVLPGMICAALLAAIGGMSLLPRLGEHMDVPGEDYSGYGDAVQTKLACDREPPEIVRKGAGTFQPGQEFSVGQVFQGMDAAGNPVNVQVLDIRDGQGNRRMDCYRKEGQKIVFPSKGIYMLELQAIDGQRKPARKKFMLLADNR